MRRSAATLAATAFAAAGAAVVPAHAGQPVSNGTDTAQFEVTVHPSTTAPHGAPRPVALELNLRHTTVSGAPAARLRTARFQLPNGMYVNIEPKPTCRLSALLLHSVHGCSKHAQVGTGLAVLDARPAGGGYPLRARVRVFSGLVDVPPPPAGFRPPRELIVYAFAPGADVFLPLSAPRHGPSIGVAPGPLTVPLGVNVERIDVTFRAMHWPKAEGGKPVIQAPTRCTGTWRFTADIAFDVGGLSPTDDVPCTSQ